MFDRVLKALHMLDADCDTEHTPPTKLPPRIAAAAEEY